MSPPRKLALLLLLSLGLLGTASLLILPGLSSDQAQAAVLRRLPPRVAEPPPALSPAVQQQLQQQTALATAALSSPTQWSRPPQRAVLLALQRDQQGAELFARSGGSEPPADALAGSYATLLPNQIGETTAESRLSADYLITHLRRDFSLNQQSSQNIALVPGPTRDFDLIGSLLLTRASNTEEAGWYLITLHLANPTAASYRIRNGFFCVTGPFEGGTILDRTDTISAHGTAMVPVLYEWRASASNWRRLMWSMQVTPEASGPPLVVFQGLTVDRL